MNTASRITFSRRTRNTPFTSRVLAKGAKAFTVYNHMLLATEFDTIEEDCRHLCSAVQVWDVGVERQVSIKGRDATRLVQWMTPRDVSNVSLDRCVYLPLADEHGKLINDPVGLRLDTDHWWLSVADSDVILWAKGLARGANLDVVVDEPDVWPLAVQGPLAETLMTRVFGEVVQSIRFFRYARLDYCGHEFIVARSGWSKQGGFEVYVDDVALGQALYDELFEKGRDLDVRPGCPNALERMEGGLLSYGNDMDSRHSLLESGLGSFIDLDAQVESLSIDALRAERDMGLARRLMGLVIATNDGPSPLAEQPFVVASHEQLSCDESAKTPNAILPEAIMLQRDVTNCLGSQVYSPRYQCQLATAMLDEPLASQSECEVLLANGVLTTARICSLPFEFEKLGVVPAVLDQQPSADQSECDVLLANSELTGARIYPLAFEFEKLG